MVCSVGDILCGSLFLLCVLVSVDKFERSSCWFFVVERVDVVVVVTLMVISFAGSSMIPFSSGVGVDINRPASWHSTLMDSQDLRRPDLSTISGYWWGC